jgi:hypothetical protein
MNISIPVPDGTSNHGNPHLLCTPPQWYDFVIFYFGNYLAHVATVRTPQGTKWGFTVSISVAVLFVPTIGLFIGFGTFYMLLTDLLAGVHNKGRPWQRAVRCGALCTIVKEETPESSTKPENTDRNQATTISRPCPSEWWPTSIPRNKSGRHDRSIQGVCILPSGYELVIVPPAFRLRPTFSKPDDMSNTEWQKTLTSVDIQASYNLPRALISLIQAIWGIITVYRARGDQIDRYGYAAFGLTVIPYAMMSIFNLLAGLISPEYPCLFLVSSPDLIEAERHGGRFDSIVAEIDTTFPPSQSAAESILNNILVYTTVMTISFAHFIVVGILSEFRENASTPSQRAWTLAWMIGNTVLPYISLITITSRFSGLISLLAFVPAIGGIVVVGQMLKDYGICTLVG